MKDRFWLGTVVGLFALTAVLCFFTGCETTPTPPPGDFAPLELDAPAVGGDPGAVITNRLPGISPEADVIAVSDALIVALTDLPQPVQPFDQKVKDDGTITLLLNETFVATNKTIRALEQEVRARYVPRLFPRMTVSIKREVGTRYYTVSGEVRQPSQRVYLDKITVSQAIAACGHFSEFAWKSNVKLIRANGQTVIVDCNKAIGRPSPKTDPLVYPGDQIFVPRKWW